MLFYNTVEPVLKSILIPLMRAEELKEFRLVGGTALSLQLGHRIDEMIALHQKRYPYSHDRNLIIKHFTDFSLADAEPDPNCLEGKYWELIKLDFEEKIEQIKK
ncbi:hypothetical protein IMZ16_01075 [Cruoricaptor ignavus]|uniref:Nucleotidyl transferase AbiEii toxin, Type IV TA system n=1 Tax=Cruoricaptor ignavus TaxID=1118202 RepID=A0A7M1T2I9_9FLAO|nr:hypothetical protein [Cruoricaptor ignavus]QOR74070.1 hypothetical protein IMZ16_01075 [Cruoricaptor ignavus]